MGYKPFASYAYFARLLKRHWGADLTRVSKQKPSLVALRDSLEHQAVLTQQLAEELASFMGKSESVTLTVPISLELDGTVEPDGVGPGVEDAAVGEGFGGLTIKNYGSTYDADTGIVSGGHAARFEGTVQADTVIANTVVYPYRDLNNALAIGFRLNGGFGAGATVLDYYNGANPGNTATVQDPYNLYTPLTNAKGIALWSPKDDHFVAIECQDQSTAAFSDLTTGTADSIWADTTPHPTVVVDGVTVRLPRTRQGDPNVRAGAFVVYGTDAVGHHYAVTDYMDDARGTLKFWNLGSLDVPDGWAICDGTNNSIALGGSGRDLVGTIYQGEADIDDNVASVKTGGVALSAASSGTGTISSVTLSATVTSTEVTICEAGPQVGYANLPLKTTTASFATDFSSWPTCSSEKTELTVDPCTITMTALVSCSCVTLQDATAFPYLTGCQGCHVHEEVPVSDNSVLYDNPIADFSYEIEHCGTHCHCITDPGHNHHTCDHCHDISSPTVDHCHDMEPECHCHDMCWGDHEHDDTSHSHYISICGHPHGCHSHTAAGHTHDSNEPAHGHSLTVDSVSVTIDPHGHDGGLPVRSTVIPIERVT